MPFPGEGDLRRREVEIFDVRLATRGDEKRGAVKCFSLRNASVMRPDFSSASSISTSVRI